MKQLFISVLLLAQLSANAHPLLTPVFPFVFKENVQKWLLKNIENSFVKVTDNLYMGDTEVTIQQYNYFLTDLLEKKDFNTLMVVKAEKTDWRSLLPENAKTLDDKTIFPNGNPDNPKFPAQNMSYEGAVEFCKWMTDFYNKEDIEKRKWKKVVFRLPTEEEWMTAARGKKDKNVKYPWGTDKPTTVKGCFLSNFNSRDEHCETCPLYPKVFDKLSKDGALFTTQADAYFPNDIGIYGIIGNVAEMTATRGIAKGGSWEDVPADCTIQSQKKYTNPSPAIGFRVLMEIQK
jgi:formylglycine-generating enzyme required for sulfatase activity